MPNRFIQKLQGFVDLTGANISALEEATSSPLTFGPRQDLIREGDRPGPLLVVLEGWAIRYKILPTGTRQVMAFMMPGDCCDLNIGMLSDMDHSIQTVTTAVVANIEGKAMAALMFKHPRIAQAMYIAQLIDASTLRAWIVSLGRRSSAERAAHLLLELYIRGIRSGAAGLSSIELPLSQMLLADALGMTPVHINRMLQAFRRAGAVELRRGLLLIHDPGVLARISGFDDNYLHKRLQAYRQVYPNIDPVYCHYIGLW